jgi:hypothetical protein
MTRKGTTGNLLWVLVAIFLIVVFIVIWLGWFGDVGKDLINKVKALPNLLGNVRFLCLLLSSGFGVFPYIIGIPLLSIVVLYLFCLCDFLTATIE